MKGKIQLIAIIVFMLLAVANVRSVQAFTSEGCDSDCKKCHSFTLKEAEDILRQLNIKDPKVLNIKISPAKGLWEVVLEENGKPGVMYVDFAKQHVMPGPVIELSTKTNKTAEELERISDNRKIDVSAIPLKNAIVMGNPKATVKVIVFTDPDCPFCAKLHLELKKIVEKRKDIVFYLKLFPLPMHKDSYWKATTIVCGKALKLMDDNFAGKPIRKSECKTGEVDGTIKLAQKMGITSTPTIILPDGRLRSGALQADKLIELIVGSK